MRDRQQTEGSNVPDRLGVLTRECQVRVLNCSVSGCLIETKSRFLVCAESAATRPRGGRCRQAVGERLRRMRLALECSGIARLTVCAIPSAAEPI